MWESFAYFFYSKGVAACGCLERQSIEKILAIRSTKSALGLVLMTTEKDVYTKAT